MRASESDTWLAKMIQNMCVNNCLPVKSTNRFPITDVKYVKGVGKNISATHQVITEQADNGEPGVLVCPRLPVLSLRNTGKTKRVTVKVCNISASAVKIFPRTNICQVSQVQVVDFWNPRSLASMKKKPILTELGVR